MLYWISWVQPTNDYRPLAYPPHEAILGWWCSGYAEDGATLCAMVTAESEDGARAAVRKEWPEANDWRFCDEREDATLSNRWQIADWMVPRLAAVSSNAALSRRGAGQQEEPGKVPRSA
jgi:hypothetical protein